MDPTVFQIQDGRHKFQPIRSRIKNSRWRRPRNVSHIGKQPTSLDRGTGIGLTDFHGDTNHAKCHASLKLLPTVSCGTKRQSPVLHAAMLKSES